MKNMKKKRGGKMKTGIGLAVFAVSGALALTTAHAATSVTAGNARFTLLTDRMVRCEWSADGTFEDRPSLTFVNRDMPEVKHKVTQTGNGVVIRTDRLTLEWTGGAFAETNLFANGVAVLADDRENLYGTTRTLDNVTGFADLMPKMEKGLLSRRGVTVVDDTKTPLFVDSSGHFGRWVSERPTRAEGGYRDLTVFAYGHDYKGCLGDYVKVAGRIPLPPRWAFGYWWSRYWLYTDKEVRGLIDQMQAVGYPIDVFIIDMEWHETWNIADRPDRYDEFGQLWGWTGYTWNRDLFPDPAATLAYLHDRGCKVALNLHPASGVQPVEESYGAFCRDYGWTGTNAVPFRADDEKWADCYFRDVIGPLERDGVDFWWLDWQQWKRSKDKPSLSNTFWLNHIFAAHSADRGGRPFIYHRWGGLGSHRYQVGFSGDCKVSWDMLAAIPWFTAAASNVGYGYWGHDIGGHHKPDGDAGRDGELFTRWLQSGVFTPIFKTHSTKNAAIERRAWKYPDHFDALMDALRLRYRLAPYIYTAAREAYETGVSICRPMYYDSPEDERAYHADNQYMFGDDILAVTITNAMAKGEHVSKTEVFLPAGAWYDVASGELLAGGRIVTREYAIDQNPWFVRAGAIIPLYPKSVRNLAEVGTDDLELLFAPGADEGACEIYEDDGDNADYATRFRKTRVVRRGGRVVIGPRAGSYTLRFPCLSQPARVTVDGVDCAWSWDAADFAVVVKTPRADGSRETVVEIAFPEGAAMIDGRLPGLKGRQREIDAVTEEFKVELRRVHWAINLPKSWQTFWQTPAAVAARPQEMGARLRERERARRAFLEQDLPRFEGKFDTPFAQRLRACAERDGLPNIDAGSQIKGER